MKNIESVLQINNGVAVISSEDLAILLGRKHLSILHAIDAIPAEYLRKDMFLMIDSEIFLTSNGVCMLDMSSRHLHMRQRIILPLFRFDDDYRKARWAEFHNAMPPKIIIKLLTWFGDVGLNLPALVLFKLICQLKNYDPSKTVNIPKKTMLSNGK